MSSDTGSVPAPGGTGTGHPGEASKAVAGNHLAELQQANAALSSEVAVLKGELAALRAQMASLEDYNLELQWAQKNAKRAAPEAPAPPNPAPTGATGPAAGTAAQPSAGAPGPAKPVEMFDLTAAFVISKLRGLNAVNFNTRAAELASFNVNTMAQIQRVADTCFERAVARPDEQAILSRLLKFLCDKLPWGAKIIRMVYLTAAEAPAGQGAGWYHDVAQPENEKQLLGPFATEVDAQADAHRACAFKRLFLNRCQTMFDQLAQPEAAANGTSSLLPPTAALLGHMYNVGGLMPVEIMHYCVMKLLGLDGITDVQSLDEVDMSNGGFCPTSSHVQALCGLLTLMGKKYEKEDVEFSTQVKTMPASNPLYHTPMMARIVPWLTQLTTHSHLPGAVRAQCREVLLLQASKWQVSSLEGAAGPR